MGKQIGYHYSNREYKVGDIIEGYDNFPGLDRTQHAAEEAVRSAHENGAAIRSSAVYLWDTEDRARRQWVLIGKTSHRKKYLYRIEYDEADRLHSGDLDHYSEAMKVGASQEDSRAAALRYWSGQSHGAQPPRTEVLVRRGTVLSREEFVPPAPPVVNDSDYPFLGE